MARIEQNSPTQIQRLAAQKRLYTLSKTIVAIQLGGSLLPPLAAAVLVALCPAARIWTAVYGLAFPLVDLIVLEPFKTRYQTTAASIQELFDRDVLELPDSPLKQIESADPETITLRATELERAMPGFNKLFDWYPTIAFAVPMSLTRLICQRTNLSFDSELRQRQSQMLLLVLGLLVAINVLIAIIFSFSFSTWILAVATPLQPAVIWVAKDWKRQADTIKTLQRIRKRVEVLWQSAIKRELSDVELSVSARQVQDAIFEHRRSCPPVFDHIFDKNREPLEDVAKKVATQLVSEARTAGAVPDTAEGKSA